MILEGEELHGRSGHRAGVELLERMYRQQFGEVLPEIRRTDRGKPYFPDKNIHFSISHTPNHVFCVLAPVPVGLDAEEMDRKVDPRLAEKILSEEELAQYRSAADQNRALLTFWVLKEAEAKLSGQGLRGYPNHTHFQLEDPRVQCLQGCLVAVMTE